jgi:predicted dehydrogenase
VDRRYIRDAKVYIDEKYGHEDCKSYTDFRELLDQEDIDAVIIATPHHWHGNQMIMACEKGKDVYVEKPLSNSIAESTAMVEAARRYGRVVQVGTQSRSSQKIQFACKMIQEGIIGDIEKVWVGGFTPPVHCNLPAEPTPEYMEWDLWLGPAPYRPYNTRIHERFSGRYIEYGGGVTTDNGHHFFDVAQWALGLDNTGPVEVIPVDGKDLKYPMIKYANGVKMFSRPNREGTGTTFIGSKGKIYIHAWDDIVESEPEQIQYKFYSHIKSLKTMNPDIQLVNNHLVNFLECVRTRQDPNAEVTVGANSVDLAHLSNIVHWVNRPLRWDAAKKKFINDELADRYLTRKPRAPWMV